MAPLILQVYLLQTQKSLSWRARKNFFHAKDVFFELIGCDSKWPANCRPELPGVWPLRLKLFPALRERFQFFALYLRA